LREVEAAAEILRSDYDVDADVWSLTSVNELAREGQAADRWNLINPEADKKVPFVSEKLSGTKGPIIAATDYIKAYAEQLRPYIARDYTVLGTDGFGRSDTRSKLRRFFEVDRGFIVVAALTALARDGKVKPEEITKALKDFGIDSEKPNPMMC
jgi:pyruvate dehydrogenase E1 component